MDKIRVLLFAVLVGAVSIPACAEGPIAPLGSRIALVPPAGFSVATTFAGFEDKTINASIALIELSPGGLPDLRSAVNAGTLAKQGVKMIGAMTLPDVAFDYLAVRGEQRIGDLTFDKWIMFFDGNAFTGIVTVTAQAAVSSGLSDAIVTTMLGTVRADVAPAGNPLAALPFIFEPGKRFRTQNVLAGSTVMLGESPPPRKPGEAVMMIVLAGDAPVAVGDQQAYGRQFLTTMKALAIEQIVSTTPTRVAEQPGFEYVADGKVGNDAIRVLLVALYTEKYPYFIMGYAPTASFDGALPDFRAVVESFRAKF